MQKFIPEMHYWIETAKSMRNHLFTACNNTREICFKTERFFYLFYCYYFVIQHQPWVQGQGPSSKIRKFISRGGFIFLQPSMFQSVLKGKFIHFNQCLANIRNNIFSVIFFTHGTGVRLFISDTVEWCLNWQEHFLCKTSQ